MSTAVDESAVREPTSVGAPHRSAVERVIRAMRQRLSEELTLEEMAGIAVMSPYHFNRTFRRLTGIPPSQFLSALRLEEAKRLLLTTDRPVMDVCYEVGYQSLGSFTTRFTQLVGLAPGQYRQLGQAFTTHRDQVLSLSEAPPPSHTGPALAGRVEADASVSGLVFLGLFETPIPQSRPVGCAILPRPGDFRIAIPPSGRYFLFAAGMARAENPLDYLRHGGAIRGLGSAGPFTAADRHQELHLALRAPDLLDPPLLVTLPLLIDERLTEKLGIEDEPAVSL